MLAQQNVLAKNVHDPQRGKFYFYEHSWHIKIFYVLNPFDNNITI